MIKIEKLNEVYCRVDADYTILRSIYDRFTIDLGLSKFQRRYVNPLWDGCVHLFNGKNRIIYTGLVPELLDFLYDRFHREQVDVDKKELFTPEHSLTVKRCNKILSDLKITVGGLEVTAREHQMVALYHCMMKTCRAVVVSPTGSGKSYIIYVLMRWLHAMGKKTLVLVPNISLINQMKSDFADYSTLNGFALSKELCVCTGGDKTSDKPITLANWQAIYKLPREWFESFGAVIVDEVHLAQAASIKGIMEKSTNARYRYGFTGTLSETKTHVSVIEGLFGKAVQFTSSHDLQMEGLLSKLKIKMVFLKYRDKTCDLARNWDYHSEVDFVSTSEHKEAFINALAAKLKGNALILVNLVEKQAIPLYNRLKEGTKRVFYISGSTPASEREEIRKTLEEHNDCILLATYGTCSTGINIKNIHHIVFGAAFKSKIRVLQSIGRELRTLDNKEVAVLWDLVDDLSTTMTYRGKPRTRLNYMMQHAQRRMQLYRDEKFNYEILHKVISE